MLLKVGGRPAIISDANNLTSVSKVILPGVGHFSTGIKQLKINGFDTVLSSLVKDQKISILGIS